MKNINAVLLIAAVLFFSGCSEETIDDIGSGTITGVVVEEGTNEPVENARISTNPATSTVFTDENGEFILKGIPPEDYAVQAQKESFLTQIETATVTADGSTNVIFELRDETAGNDPPVTPEAIFPEDNASAIAPPVTFVWNSADPENDDLSYQLEIRNAQDERVVMFEDIADTTYTVEGLDYNSKFFWQITASDDINPEVLSPLYSFRTKDVPEDSRILFTRQINGNSVIFTRNEEGEEFQLTPSESNSFRPRRNNATGKIAFLRTVGAETHLFTMDFDGTDERQVTSTIPVRGFDMEQIDFSWTDDGASLLYPNFDKLYKIDRAGGGTEMIFKTANGDFITEVAASEDSNRIVLLTNNSSGYDGDIFTINPAGEIQQSVLNNVAGALGGLDVSLRGNQLLFTQDISGYENDDYRQLDTKLFLYDFNTGEVTDLSLNKPSGTNDLDPRFSPNEAQVIFVNTSNDGISQEDIYTLTLDQLQNEESRELIVEDAAMPDWQ